ncbi:MAG: alpha/beta hydrolase family protein [Candidatus Hydrogenedens sp.]
MKSFFLFSNQIFYRFILLIFVFTHIACAVEPIITSETQLEHGVEVVSVKGDWNYQIITARVPYIGIEGDNKTGLARLVIPVRKLKEKNKLPAFCHVHYEKDIAGAKKWAQNGWIVSTAVYTPAEGESPIDSALGNGYNLARAIIQWIKRLPIVDKCHILIDGGSQGGYMALAMSADLFPVIATHADVPVVNWAYNFAYFEANREIAGFGKPADQSPIPVLASVIGLADMCYKYFPKDLNNECWYNLSPISYLNLITNPVMITCATGDMLVPIEQMTQKYVREYDSQQFPEGFTRDFKNLPFCPLAKKVFEELIPEDNYEIFLLQPQ